MLAITGYEGTGKGLAIVFFIWIVLVIVCVFFQD